MKRASLAAAAALALAAAQSSCIAYNLDCSLEVSNPDEVLTFFGGEVPISEELTRNRETFFGDLTADAFLAFARAQLAAADGAVVNAGSIRMDGLCQRREVLRAGRLKRKTLRDVLPFDDALVLLEVSEVQLLNALEHSVARLNGGRPAGAFLQTAGFGFTVDCSRPAESFSGAARTPGQRVTQIWVYPSGPAVSCFTIDAGTGRVVRSDASPCRWIYPADDADPAHADQRASPNRSVKLVMTGFVAEGGDGYLDFGERTGASLPSVRPLNDTRIAFQVVADHLEAKGKDSASNALAVSLDPLKPRIERLGCTP